MGFLGGLGLLNLGRGFNGGMGGGGALEMAPNSADAPS